MNYEYVTVIVRYLNLTIDDVTYEFLVKDYTKGASSQIRKELYCLFES